MSPLGILMGAELKFQCIKKDLPERSSGSSKTDKEQLLRELVEKEPVIKKIIDDFDAEIVG